LRHVRDTSATLVRDTQPQNPRLQTLCKACSDRVQHETMRRPVMHWVQAFHISTRPSAVTLCAAEGDGWIQTNAETNAQHVSYVSWSQTESPLAPTAEARSATLVYIHVRVHVCAYACMRVCKAGSDILIGGAGAIEVRRDGNGHGHGYVVRQGDPALREAETQVVRAAASPIHEAVQRELTGRRQTADEDQHLHGSGAQTATVMDCSVVHIAGDTGSSHHCAGSSWLEYEALSLILMFKGIMDG